MENKKRRTLIIGGVAGGATAAARLRRRDNDREIIVFEKGEYISYANCGLPYYVGGVIKDRNALLLMNPETMKARFDIDVRISSEVTAIDRENKKLAVFDKKSGETYEEPYDDLVIATGSSPVVPPIPGIDGEGIHTLWTVPDTDRIKRIVEERKPETAAVIGGGFIGLEMAENLQKAADEMGKGLVGWTLKYVSRAYPDLEAKKLLEARQEQERQAEKAKEKAGVFAVGCSFYKLVCLFFIGAFLGDIIETIFCWITMGRLMSRSSVVYGDFSIVWGLGCVLLTAILYQYRNRSKGYIFIFGTVVGGVYEYVCSVFTEIVFGTVFWDYSKIPFNLGGRINLLFCFFWGIVAVLWLCFLYPRLSGLIEKIPKKPGIILSWIMIVFMLFDMGMSSLALCRYTERHTEEQEVTTAVDDFFDEHFPDERMKQIYPKAILRR